jgi:hypothetical protein
MHWLNSSLNRKFAAGTAAGLLISLLVFVALFIHLYSAQLEQERTGAATQVNRLLQTSLENAMLKRDLEGLKEILNRLGQQPDVLGVSVLSARVRSRRFPGPRGQAERAGGPVRNLTGQSRRCLGRGPASKSWNSFPRHDLNQAVIAPGPVGSPLR